MKETEEITAARRAGYKAGIVLGYVLALCAAALAIAGTVWLVGRLP